MKSWLDALGEYSYPVDLFSYKNRASFPGYFSRRIEGDVDSTTEFENYFRTNAQTSIEVYYEVIFWKLYSRIAASGNSDAMDNIIRFMRMRNSSAADLLSKIRIFVEAPTLESLQDFRSSMGLRKENGALAVALTFPAFYDPFNFPIVDVNVAGWVNNNLAEQNQNRNAKLTRFENNGEPLRDNDFPNYLSWVHWCREIARLLTRKSRIWRARDVEMAVFAASRNGFTLEILP